MENKENTFYLGKREHPEEPPKPEEPKYRLSYAGALPASFEDHQPKPRTNEDLALARLLSEKHERKSMVVRRILYLEKRRQELLGYMADADKNASKATYKQSIFLLIGDLIVLLFLFFFLPLPYSLVTAVLVCIVIPVFLLHKSPLLRRERTPRQIQWDLQMEEMRDEHDALIQEKEELTAQIRELESRLSDPPL